MGRWNHESDIFGEFDTGSNNSNSSDSDDEIILPKYDWYADITPIRPPNPVTWEPSPIGIPTICYCGKPAVLKTQTIGLQTGSKFYSCAGDIHDGDCHIYKLLDDAILEEITLTKSKLGVIEGHLVGMLTTIEDEKKKLQELEGRLFGLLSTVEEMEGRL